MVQCECSRSLRHSYRDMRSHGSFCSPLSRASELFLGICPRVAGHSYVFDVNKIVVFVHPVHLFLARCIARSTQRAALLHLVQRCAQRLISVALGKRVQLLNAHHVVYCREQLAVRIIDGCSVPVRTPAVVQLDRPRKLKPAVIAHLDYIHIRFGYKIATKPIGHRLAIYLPSICL
jgi:hypothetical protein